MPSSMNIPPGPCPRCGKSLNMGQPTCFGCGFDRVLERNINEKPARPSILRMVFGTPLGFLLTSNASAVLIALAIQGSPALIQIYVVATAVIGLIAAFFLIKAFVADPPGMLQMWSDTARHFYTMEMMFGDDGPAGMQCLIVLTVVMSIASIWLNAGLPPADQIF